MKYIAFSDTCAGFAWSRLNNLLFANESLLRVEIINAHTLEFIGERKERDLPVVNEVMAMYDCQYTDDLPVGFQAYNPQPPPIKKTRRAKDYPVGIPTKYFREARS